MFRLVAPYACLILVLVSFIDGPIGLARHSILVISTHGVCGADEMA